MSDAQFMRLALRLRPARPFSPRPPPRTRPKRERAGALQDASRGSVVIGQRASVLRWPSTAFPRASNVQRRSSNPNWFWSRPLASILADGHQIISSTRHLTPGLPPTPRRRRGRNVPRVLENARGGIGRFQKIQKSGAAGKNSP